MAKPPSWAMLSELCLILKFRVIFGENLSFGAFLVSLKISMSKKPQVSQMPQPKALLTASLAAKKPAIVEKFGLDKFAPKFSFKFILEFVLEFEFSLKFVPHFKVFSQIEKTSFRSFSLKNFAKKFTP